jgi:hypothetical protein
MVNLTVVGAQTPVIGDTTDYAAAVATKNPDLIRKAACNVAMLDVATQRDFVGRVAEVSVTLAHEVMDLIKDLGAAAEQAIIIHDVGC